MKTILKICMLLFIMFCFSGCIDEPVQQNSFSINGFVYNDYGPPAPFVNVTSNYFTIFRTYFGGAFYLDNVTVPYNLILTSERSSLFSAYIGIKNPKPNIITRLGSYQLEECKVSVYFPALQSGKILFLKLLSDNYHFQFRDDFRFPISYAYFEVRILPFETFIKGKLIYLECIGDYDWIYSFEKYGIKDVTLYINRLNEITFSANDIKYNPEEKNIIVNCQGNSEEFHRTESFLYVNNSFNELGLEKNYYTNYNVFTVPVLPNLNYEIKVLDEMVNDEYEKSSKWVFLLPGENANIIHNACPKIVSPYDNQNNVSDTTTFMISNNTVAGVFKYTFMQLTDSNSYSYIGEFYSDKKIFRLKDLIPKTFKLPSNKKMMWEVTNIQNYSSIDDLVSTPYILDKKYNSLKTSKRFTFTTAP